MADADIVARRIETVVEGLAATTNSIKEVAYFATSFLFQEEKHMHQNGENTYTCCNDCNPHLSCRLTLWYN